MKTKVFYEVLGLESKKNENRKIEINRVVMNSKEIKNKDLFVAIRGGNNFVNEALEKEAYVVYDNKNVIIDEKFKDNVFLVNDSILFLQQFAKKWREALNLKIIGITGSNGKTTVKDIIYHLLRKKYKVKKTEGNYNNHIGLPFTMLRAEENDDFMILEMGMSGFGEIELLGEIAYPDVSIITNIGESHLEFLKTKANVFRAKTEILPYTKKALIINGDDEYLKEIEHIKNKFGEEVKIVKVLDMRKNEFVENTFDFYYDNIKFDEVEANFDLKYFGKKCRQNVERHYKTNLLGEHNILNEVLAIAVTKQFGMENAYIEKELKNIELTNMRFQKIEIENKLYINDAYNAAPDSMKKSLETFSEIFNNVEKIAVLGDMLELGEKEKEYHAELWKNIQKAQIDKIYLFGERMKVLYEKLLEKQQFVGIKEKEVIYFENKQDIIDKINENNNKKAILVKASRGIRLEEIIK